MANDLWLPNGYELPEGSKIRSLLFSGDKWQIYDTNAQVNVLVARSELVKKWNDHGFLDESLCTTVSFGNDEFQILSSPKRFALSPVDNFKSPASKVDALAFASSLKESRKLSDDVSFHDAVYMEQYSRLLPTWGLAPHVDDEVVLGTWITGGVVISTESFRRLCNLAGWMPANDLAEVLNAAGFRPPEDMGVLTNRKTASQSKRVSPKDKAKPEQTRPLDEPVVEKVFTLPGRPQLEDFFNEHVIDIIFNSEKYQALGIDFPSAIVLHGPPGCGKTFAVERLVEFIDWPCYSIDSNSIGSPYIHETSKKIAEIFNLAIDNAPSVIVIDEMESFLSDRNSGSSSGRHHVEEVAEFLRRIPEAIKNKVLIVAMTNLIELIDPAILRRGRFDHVIEVGMPSRGEVSSLVNSLLSKLPKEENLDLEMIFDALTGKALSDSAFVVRESARLAAKTGKTKLDQASIEAALNSLPKDQEKQSRRIGFV